MMLLIGLLSATQFAFARQFYLMTVEPGSEFWSVYGHTALVIDDDVFGFGVFSFEQEDFYQSFALNEMTYMVGHTDLRHEILWAKEDRRSLTLLALNIPEQAQDELLRYLRWHFKPENQSYAYDYFLQNCATKIRDILNSAMNGELEQSFSAKTSDSYFTETFPVKNQSLMTLGLAIAYGHQAYQPRSGWELMAFPERLRTAMLDDQMLEWRGELDEVVSFAESQGLGSLIQTHWLLAAISVFLLAGLWFKKSQGFTLKLWLFAQSMIGAMLLLLWLSTAHEMAAWNVQLLLFFPLAILSIKFQQLSRVMLAAVALWLPLAVWQGSWYIWPFAIINVWTGLLIKRQSITSS